MPCGGIRPVDESLVTNKTLELKTLNDQLEPEDGGCWVCGLGGCRHFLEEYDTFIHAICALKFLQSTEGQIVIHHKHTIELDFNLEGNVAGHQALEVLRRMTVEELDEVINKLKEASK